MGRDSVAGIAIRYGLNGKGIESRWSGGGRERDFFNPSRPVLYNWYRVSFAGL